jgi:hypothetical protein
MSARGRAAQIAWPRRDTTRFEMQLSLGIGLGLAALGVCVGTVNGTLWQRIVWGVVSTVSLNLTCRAWRGLRWRQAADVRSRPASPLHGTAAHRALEAVAAGRVPNDDDALRLLIAKRFVEPRGDSALLNPAGERLLERLGPLPS